MCQSSPCSYFLPVTLFLITIAHGNVIILSDYRTTIWSNQNVNHTNLNAYYLQKLLTSSLVCNYVYNSLSTFIMSFLINCSTNNEAYRHKHFISMSASYFSKSTRLKYDVTRGNAFRDDVIQNDATRGTIRDDVKPMTELFTFVSSVSKVKLK